MEKHKTLSCKSTRFIILTLTLSFSILLLSYLFTWAMQTSPFIHQEAYFLLNNSLNLQSFTASFTDLPTNTVNNTFLPNTHLQTSQISPGFVANFTVSNSSKKVDFKVFTDLSLKGGNLGVTHFSKAQNVSGFVRKSSIFEGKVGKVNRSSENIRGKVDEDSGKNRGKVDEDSGKNRGKVCDISKGKWVFDEKYPLYTNVSCPFIDEGFNCQGNGRLDLDYMKWRWQPYDCDIPRFNATNMLELIRGKRLVFSGDSINRNQWESLLCLLMGAVKDPRRVYETRGRRITKQRGTYSFRFVDYKCTVEFYVSHFLVRESKARIGKKRKGTLRIDSIDRESIRWRGADILVFNTGNWWSHYKTKAGKNYYQEGNEIYPHLDPITAYRKALVTWATWIDKNIDSRKTHILFRSSAPAHFREGQWNTGGHCREARKPLNEMYIENPTKDVIALDIINTMNTPVTFLNVSGLSSYRIDGHPSKYGRNIVTKGRSVEDCSHWCIPGVPDAWNELLYHQIVLKQQKTLYGS